MQSSYAQSAYRGSSSGSSYTVDRLVTTVFRDLATNENMIEMKRQDLCRHPDFEPMKLFQHVDRSGNGQISVSELYDFMNKNYLSPRMTDADDIVREYDGTQNRLLDFDEFCQLAMPSTNPNLRHLAQSRRYSPYYRVSDPLPYEVLGLFSRLLEREMQLQRARNESKRQLASCPDFVNMRAFDAISRGCQAISMPDLIYFLERNSFFARSDDQEAILRRCDHDANRQISFAEFCENVSFNAGQQAAPMENRPAQNEEAQAENGARDGGEDGMNEANGDGEDENNDFERVENVDEDGQGPNEKQASAEKNAAGSSARKRSRGPPADNLTPAQRQQKRDQEERLAQQQRAEIDQHIEAEKQKVREEQERLENLEKERQVENFMLLRMVKLMIEQNRRIEDARAALTCHKTFSINDSFRLFDINQNGVIATDEITHVFGEHNIELTDVPRLVELLDDDDDGTIDLREWEQGVHPMRPCRGSDYGPPNLSLEQKNLFQRAWLEQLASVFGLMIQADAEINDKRNQLQLDGERLFADMDKGGYGQISVHNFAAWVADNCGFQILDEDLPGLEKSLDGGNYYRITKQAFIESVSAPKEDEEEEDDQAAGAQQNSAMKAGK